MSDAFLRFLPDTEAPPWAAKSQTQRLGGTEGRGEKIRRMLRGVAGMRHNMDNFSEDYPHMEITGAIIGAAIKVQKSLGPGLLENAYKFCLAHQLMLDGYKVAQEVHLDIVYEGLCIPNAYIMDLAIDNKVVVEIKAVERFVDAHYAQVNSYLRFSNMEIGLLINFRAWPIKSGGIKRVINTQKY